MNEQMNEQNEIVFQVVGNFCDHDRAGDVHVQVVRLFRKEEDAKAFASELDAKHKAAEAALKERDALLTGTVASDLRIQQANREVGLTSEMIRLALFGPWDPEVRPVKVY